MTPYSQRFMFRLLGISRELEYLPDEIEQRAAWKAVSAQVNRDRFAWLPYALFPILFPLIGFLIVRPVGAALRISAHMPPWVFDTIVLTAMGVFLGYAEIWLARRRYRSVLRAHLNHIGVPTCVACGYSLTGVASTARCPECGQARSA